MVKISEITSDDGGDPNKKPQEQVQRLQIPQDLPEEINESILALVERCDYPTLLCSSKAFVHIITSPRLFETRSDLGRTEHLLYTFIGFPPFFLSRWYILHRRNNSLRLSMISSLPPLIPGSAVVTVGHDMYILGGKLNSDPPVSTVIVIDYRFHTWRRLPSMRRARYHAAAGVIDGKIYVIGGCIKRGGEYNWIEVFDVKNQIWETVPDPDPNPNPNNASMDGDFAAYVVMENKIYILDRTVNGVCFAYEPRTSQWETLRPLRSQLWWYWHVSSCVVDDMLYSIDSVCFFGYPIVVYDPRYVVWRPVKGVRRFDLLNLVYHESKMANLGGKLVILGSNYPSWGIWERDVWCQVIALERREDGEIWGSVESKSRVLSSSKSPLIEFCRTVTV